MEMTAPAVLDSWCDAFRKQAARNRTPSSRRGTRAHRYCGARQPRWSARCRLGRCVSRRTREATPGGGRAREAGSRVGQSAGAHPGPPGRRVTHFVRISPETEAELEAAALWYETKRAGLGADFVVAIDAALEGVADAPYSHPVWRQGRPLRRHVARAVLRGRRSASGAAPSARRLTAYPAEPRLRTRAACTPRSRDRERQSVPPEGLLRAHQDSWTIQ